MKKFDSAPLLMDGRQDRVTGEVGANRINQLRLERLSAETQKPIVVMRAYHDKPKTKEGKRIKPEEMKAVQAMMPDTQAVQSTSLLPHVMV